MSVPSSLRFESELQGTFQALRRALLELFASAGEDPATPYPASRRLGLDKTLVWKAARVARASDPAEAVRHLPGQAGVEILLKGFREAGAPEEALEAVSLAVRSFQHLVRAHTGDRATLELMLDGMRRDETLEASRKLAFRGNSGIWGVQAKVRHSTYLLAPNADDPARVDVALVSGYRRFQRLRPDLAWPLLHLRTYGTDEPRSRPSRAEPLDAPTGAAGALHFLAPFCTQPLPEVRRVQTEDRLIFELLPGPIGKQGAMDLVFADVERAVGPRYRDADGDVVEMRAELFVPVETLLLELHLHDDLAIEGAPRFELDSRLFGEPPPPGEERGRVVLPTGTEVEDLGHDATRQSAPSLPRYSRILAHAFDRLAWDPAAFHGWRATLAYPPIPTTPLLRFQQAARGGE